MATMSGADESAMDQVFDDEIRVKRRGTEDSCILEAPADLEAVLEHLEKTKRWIKGALSKWNRSGREVYLVGRRELVPGEYTFEAWEGVRGPQALSDFWLALDRAEFSQAGKVLSLVDGTSFLGDPRLGKKLYYRNCYERMERELKQIFAQEDDSGEREYDAVAIMGNPGIGKSLFGYLLLYRWAREGRRVVVVKQYVCPKPTLLTAEGAFELDYEALRDELEDPEVRYLVDNVNPGCVGPLPRKAQMVLVTNPGDTDVYQEVWKRKGYTCRYMDTWSWDELAKCHESIFPQEPIEEVQDRYDRWGGIPRYVFEKLEEADQAQLIVEIKKTNLAMRLGAAGAVPSHKLLHLRVGFSLLDTWMETASDYVAERVTYIL